MADPYADSLGFLDLVGQPQDVAANRSRARAAALGRERAVALASMYSPDPEFQKAGADQFARAEGERQGVLERMPEGVLRLALEKLNQERQLSALNLQGEQIRGQLGIAQEQLRLQSTEPFIRAMLDAKTEEDKIKAIASFLGPLGKTLGEKLSAPARARGEAAEKVLKKTQGIVTGKGTAAPGQASPAPAPVTAAPNTALHDALRLKYQATAKKE